MKRAFLSELLFPPKCVGCGERLDSFEDTFDGGYAFCVNCRAEWEREKLNACPTCRVAAIECTCRPEILDKKHIDCISLVKFGRVQSADRLIYSLKKTRKNFDFASTELAKRFLTYAEKTDKDISNAIFTNVPRKRASIARFGFDHAKILAKMIAEKSGYPYEELLMRTGNAKDQKKLTLKERGENVKGNFELAVEGRINEKTVVLVDDVVTTGNTAHECIRVLRAGGVKNVVLISIAHAPEKKTAKRKRRAGRKNSKND